MPKITSLSKEQDSVGGTTLPCYMLVNDQSSFSNPTEGLMPISYYARHYPIKYSRGINHYVIGADENIIKPDDSFISSRDYAGDVVPIYFPPTVSLIWTESLILPTTSGEFSRLIRRLKSFSDLEEGWDSYGAKPIELSTIIRAIDFISKILYSAKENPIPVPFIAPLSNGGIQFEWKTFYREFICSLPESEKEPVEYLKVERNLWKDKEKEGHLPYIDNTVEMIIQWLR